MPRAAETTTKPTNGAAPRITKKALAAIRAQEIADAAEVHFDKNPGKLFIPPAPRATNALGIGNTLAFDYSGLDEAFPSVDPGLEPFGSLVLVLIRQPKASSAGGIIVDTESRKTDHYNTQIAKVIAIGPIAFLNRNTGEPWPEGAWARIGDFVRVPRYGGDRWTMDYQRDEIQTKDGKLKTVRVTDEVHFALFKDLDLRGRFTGDPLKVKTFV